MNRVFTIELDLYCDWYFSYVPCKPGVTGDTQMGGPFPTFLVL